MGSPIHSLHIFKVVAVQQQLWQRENTTSRDPANLGVSETPECPLCSRGGFLDSLESHSTPLPHREVLSAFWKSFWPIWLSIQGGSLPTWSSHWLEGRGQKQGTCVWCYGGSGLCKQAFAHFPFDGFPILERTGRSSMTCPTSCDSWTPQQDSELGQPNGKACALPSLGLAGMGEGRVHGHIAHCTHLQSRNKLIWTCQSVGWPCTPTLKY